MKQDLYIRAKGLFINALDDNKDNTDKLLESLNINTDTDDEPDNITLGSISFFISQIEMINETADGNTVLHFKSNKVISTVIPYADFDDLLRDWNDDVNIKSKNINIHN